MSTPASKRARSRGAAHHEAAGLAQLTARDCERTAFRVGEPVGCGPRGGMRGWARPETEPCPPPGRQLARGVALGARLTQGAPLIDCEVRKRGEISGGFAIQVGRGATRRQRLLRAAGRGRSASLHGRITGHVLTPAGLLEPIRIGQGPVFAAGDVAQALRDDIATTPMSNPKDRKTADGMRKHTTAWRLQRNPRGIQGRSQ